MNESVSPAPPPARPSGPLVDAERADGWRSWLGRALLEALLIVFSVLLALSLDSWREHRERASRLAEARGALVAELRVNRQALEAESILAHHRRLLRIYQEMNRAGRVDRVDAIFETGIHRPALRDASWRSFSVSDVAGDLPFSQRALLAGIYGEQTNLDSLYVMLLANVSQPTADRENPIYLRDVGRSIMLALNDIVYTEERLIARYGEAMTALQTGAGS